MPARVTAVVPTLLTRRQLLDRCLESLEGCDIVVCVDRPTGSVPVDGLERHSLVWTGGGAGFAGAAQLGVTASKGEFVLFLNDDAWLERGAVDALIDAVSSDRTIAGAAPKVRFEAWPEILNSVGTILMSDGWADSRGIGQPDVGQYDRPERVFGLHFAAALVRRNLFNESAVGPLDVTFQMYYEDIDWCLRANLRGHGFVTVPDAVAFHGHSTTARDEAFEIVFRLQERNRIWTVLKGFEAAHAARAAGRRLAVMGRNWLRRGPLARASAAVIREALMGWTDVHTARRRIQRQRRIRDAEIFAMSTGERSWFDQRSGPVVELPCLIESLGRRTDGRELARDLQHAVSEGDSSRIARALDRAPAGAVQYWRRLGRNGLVLR